MLLIIHITYNGSLQSIVLLSAISIMATSHGIAPTGPLINVSGWENFKEEMDMYLVVVKEDMDKFSHVSKLRSVVSGLTVGSDFNSCIVNFYADGSARTRPHSDEESYIDQLRPMAFFSVGKTREIVIFDKKDGKLFGKHSLLSVSLFVMNPATQANT